jgi:hypothetical protein
MVMSKSERVRVTVLVDDTHLEKMKSVARSLAAKGFDLDKDGQLDAIGVLTGSVPADRVPQLRDLSGVKSVEEERTDYRPQ